MAALAGSTAAMWLPSSEQLWVPGFQPGDIVIVLEREGLASWQAAEVIAADDEVVSIRWMGLLDSEIVQRPTWQVAILNLKAAYVGSGS